MLPQSTSKIMIWLEFTLSKDIHYIYSSKWNICDKDLQFYPLKWRRGPFFFFYQSWISFSFAKWCSVSNLVKNGRAVLEMKSKMWQNLQTGRQTDKQTDGLQRNGYEILLELSAQVSKKGQQSALVCGIRIKPTCKTLYLLFFIFWEQFWSKEYTK